ncbi:MAG: energy-coupling factor transporter transmembrane protein EcfT [Firmicutes bacterium]|nr:energy-coupling factor transporter transmembrane protein EcfT [Bacillota bacterium]
MAIKDITLGQYYPGDSVIHRLDPRTKLIGTVLFLVSLFVVKSFTGFLFCAICLGVLVKLSGVPFKFMARGLKAVMFLIVFTAVINLFMTPGTPIWQFGILKIAREGIYRAVFMAIRLVMLIFGSSLLTLTTKPVAMTDGMERLFRPLAKLGLPSHELAMMMTIALRFVPTLLDETDKIMKAQTARGADFESGNLRERAKGLIPLLVPLFVSAFRIAADLAMAMEARCYRGGEGRTRMNGMAFARRDVFAAILMILYFAAVIVIARLPLF